MSQSRVRKGWCEDSQLLESGQTPDLCDHAIGRSGGPVKLGSDDVAEIVDSNEIRKPMGCPGFPEQLPMVAMPNAPATGFPDRPHCIALNVSAADNPPQ